MQKKMNEYDSESEVGNTEKNKRRTMIEILKDSREKSEIEKNQKGCGLVITASEDKSIRIFQIISS